MFDLFKLLYWKSKPCLEAMKEGNVLFNEYSTHFIYGYMGSDIITVKDHLAREETHCCHFMDY